MEGEQTNKRVIILGIVLFIVLMGVMYFMSLEQRDALEEQRAATESQYGTAELTMVEERDTLTPEEMASLLEAREEARRVAALQESGGDIADLEFADSIGSFDNLEE